MVFDLPRSVVGGTDEAAVAGAGGALFAVDLSLAAASFGAAWPATFGSAAAFVEPAVDGVGDLALVSAGSGVPALDGGGAGLGVLDDATGSGVLLFEAGLEPAFGGSGVPLLEAGGTGVPALEPVVAGSGVPLFGVGGTGVAGLEPAAVEDDGSGVPLFEAGGTGVPGLEAAAGGSGVDDFEAGGGGAAGFPAGSGGAGDLVALVAPGPGVTVASAVCSLTGAGERRADLMAGAAGAAVVAAAPAAVSVIMVGSSMSRLMDCVKPATALDGAALLGSPVSSIVSMSSRGCLLLDMNLTKATRVVLVTSDRFGLYSAKRTQCQIDFDDADCRTLSHPSASHPPPPFPGCTSR